MDSRDLNYSKYFNEGETINKEVDDYTSHNTHRLNKEIEVQELLLNLDFIKESLGD